jgi:hypothetical protein
MIAHLIGAKKCPHASSKAQKTARKENSGGYKGDPKLRGTLKLARGNPKFY